MPQLTQIGQPVLLIAVPVVLFAVVYFLSKIKPIGGFFATVTHVPGIVFRSIAGFLLPFGVQEKPTSSKYPGLRTIVLVIASIFAIVATVADGFLTNQALVALTDDTSLTFTLPANLSWLNLSQGWLLLSIPAIAGMILLDTYFQVVPEEARIFRVPTDATAKKRFERFILLTFFLSLVTSIAFNALKPAYMQDTGSWETLVLRIVVFVVLGSMLPLCIALTVFIISLAIHSLFSLALRIVWFIALMFARILAFLARRFSPDEDVEKDDAGIVIDSTTFVRVENVAVKNIAIDNLKTQLLTSKFATNILTGSTIVTSVDGDDIQTAFPDPSLHGLNGHDEPIDLTLNKDQSSVTSKNGETETSNVEKETSNNKTSDDEHKKQKPGVRRSLKLFDYQKEYLPTAEQSDHKVSSEKTVKQTSSTRKRKTPVKPATSRSRTNKTTKTQASTKASSNAAK